MHSFQIALLEGVTELDDSTTKCWQTGEDSVNVSTLPFELFYLKELLAEGIISKDLFDMTYNQLTKESNKQMEET